jgi:protease-4
MIVSMTAVAAAYLLMYGEPPVPAQAAVVLRIGDLAEAPGAFDVGELFGARRSLTLEELLEALRKAKVDPRVRAVLVVPSGVPAAYWARLQEVRDAIIDFRESGKPAYAYLEYGGQREYYLATACDQIVLMPNSPLDLTGLASYEMFLRGTFEKVGAVADLEHIGDYKTASNQLTEETFTPAHREMSESLNRDLFEQLVQGIAAGRNKPEAEVLGLVDEGPFLGEAALQAGLVDTLAYEDQIDDLVAGPDGPIERLEGTSYARVRASSAGLRTGARVGLIHVSGTIASGRSGFDPIYGSIVGSENVVAQIRQARDDASLRAVVVRIDSPGGSTIASDVIWRELEVMREKNPDRPVVVSMADLAASGGYYIAMPADAIVAQPGTLTGSIGIYGGKIITGGLYEKLGVHIETISRGRFADMNSPVRLYSEAERAKLGEQLQAFYDQFVQKVAAARDMTPEQVDAVAQGRVWTGRQAKEHGLVDELGGLGTAVAVAKRRADIAEDVEVELVSYFGRRGLFDLLVEQFSRSASGWLTGALPAVVSPDVAAIAAPAGRPGGLFRRGESLALMPSFALP